MPASTFDQRRQEQQEHVERIRATQDAPYGRAVMALARHDAENTGLVWDTLPWTSKGRPGALDQTGFVVAAASRIDALLDADVAVLPTPPKDHA